MRDVRRLLWSAVVLSLAGCQSISTGSSALLDRLNDTLSTSGELSRTSDSRALFSSRGARRSAASVDSPSEDLADRRRSASSQQAGALHDREPVSKTLSPAGEQQEPAAQQIILTAERNAGNGTPTSGSAAQARETQRSDVDQQSNPHWDRPLVKDSRSLSAPRPAGAQRFSREPADDPLERTDDEVLKASVTGVTPVFDVFGVGGESRAARAEIEGAATIRPPGHSDSRHGEETAAGAIARDLESDKVSQSIYWQEDLDKLITLLEAQVAQQHPGDTDEERELFLRQHVALRMLYLIASRRPEALQSIPQVDPEQQQFWTQMFWALSSTFDDEAMPDGAQRAAETLDQLREAVRYLEPQAALHLERTLLCRQINGFGDFVTFEQQTFHPGQPVLIYTEVRNFQSEATTEGEFRTALRSSITIQEQQTGGPVVFEYELPETEDRCRTRRNDYFHSYRIQLPRNLKPGPHVLTLEVTDTLSRKSGTARVNFVVQ